MGWSWRDLDETPEYVQRYAWDFMQARITAENNANEAASEGHGRA